MAECTHGLVAPEVCDQTLGVACLICRKLVAVCWADDHVSEFLWNRAVEGSDEFVPCEQNRDDHCAICEEPISGGEVDG